MKGINKKKLFDKDKEEFSIISLTETKILKLYKTKMEEL